MAELLDQTPLGLRRDWPVPRQEVLGDRDGVVAWIEYLLARGALASAARLPEIAREALVSSLAHTAKAAFRSRSDAARTFLTAAFGALPSAELDARVLQAWKHFLRITIESAGFERHVELPRIREHFEFGEMCAEARARIGNPGGAILVTGHIGDWEASSALLPWIGFDPLYVIAKPPKNRPLSAHLQRVREARGLRVLPRRGAMQLAPAVIRGGGSLGMLLDQRAHKRPVLAPFFGRAACCDRTAGVLLRRLRAPVFVGACYRTGPWRWRIAIPACFEPVAFARASPVEIAAALNAEFEKLIRAAPEQYFWLHDRYRGATEAQIQRETPPENDDDEDGG